MYLYQKKIFSFISKKEEEKQERQAIQVWRELGSMLDALSNQHFTPKVILGNDLKVLSTSTAAGKGGSLPALKVEEMGKIDF